ncbi:MAG TPA: hypothetical protein VKZ67_14730 [Natronosporangium sp.]|nr:hypothetical protein [Natronosporangium sp.]
MKSVTASVLALYFLLLLEYGIWRGALIAAGLGATAALLASVCGMRRSGFRVTRRRWSRPRWRHLTRAGRVILPVVTAGYAGYHDEGVAPEEPQESKADRWIRRLRATRIYLTAGGLWALAWWLMHRWGFPSGWPR